MKKLLALVALLPSLVFASPTLSADPVVATAVQPATAELNVNGGASWQTCTFVPAGGDKVMNCDLVGITVPGAYTLLARYTYVAGCNATGTCWAAGSAVSTPFTYNWTGVPALKPTAIKIVTP